MLFRRAVLSFLLVSGLAGQEFRALLQGTVTDPTGAVIPRAQVVLRSVSTGLERSSVADRAGRYVFQLLPPGNYTLTVLAAGFRTTTQDNITLRTNERARIDVSLTLGPASSTIYARSARLFTPTTWCSAKSSAIPATSACSDT